MDLLPENNDTDYFSPVIQEATERYVAYREKREAAHIALYNGIKDALLENPKTPGTVIAKRLHVPPHQIYEIWGKVREDIENQDKEGKE